MLDVQDVPKRPRLDLQEDEEDEVPKRPRLDDEIRDEQSIFVETALFGELLDKVAKLKPGKNCIALLGPKGFGKTSFLRKLGKCYPDNSIYIDLGIPCGEISTSMKYILLDNAHIFDRTTHVLPPNKMIIAAFSPAKARAKVGGNVGYKALCLSCGGSGSDFFMRPFTYSETKKLAKELGFTIVKEPTDFIQKKIKYLPFEGSLWYM